MSVTNDLLAGKVDARRLSEYADWVELLFKYADKAVLTTGNYDAQVGAFASGQAAFLHQGNWVDPNMAQAKATFTMAFAPHGSMAKATDGIFVAAPSFYAINKNSKSVTAAKKFLNDLVFTEAGNKYMVVDAGMIPAYSNVKLNPTGQLSRSVKSWAACRARSTAGTSTISPRISGRKRLPRSTTSSPMAPSPKPNSSIS